MKKMFTQWQFFAILLSILVTLPQKAQSQCDAGQTEFELVVTAPSIFGTEVFWEVLDENNNPVISVSCAETNTAAIFGTFSFCGNVGDVYTFNAYDSWGDGWNGSGGVGATWLIRIAGTTQVLGSGDGGTNSGLGSSFNCPNGYLTQTFNWVAGPPPNCIAPQLSVTNLPRDCEDETYLSTYGIGTFGAEVTVDAASIPSSAPVLLISARIGPDVIPGIGGIVPNAPGSTITLSPLPLGQNILIEATVLGFQCPTFAPVFESALGCPIPIEACGEGLEQSYCYGNNDTTPFTYVSPNGEPLVLFFENGTIEACCDDITIYEGIDATGPILFQGNNGGSLAGVAVESASGEIHMVLDTDFSVSCQSGTPTEWNWTVGCGLTIPGCTDPDAVNFFPLANEDDGTCIFGGTDCNDPGVITSLPYTITANTNLFGDTYSSADLPPLAPGAFGIGSGSGSYLNGDDVTFEYTPAENEFVDVTVSNISTWVGFWIFKGCPLASTEYFHTVSGTEDRFADAFELEGGETYYFVISTFPAPQSTPFTFNIQNTVFDCPDLNANIDGLCEVDGVQGLTDENCNCVTEDFFDGCTTGTAATTTALLSCDQPSATLTFVQPNTYNNIQVLNGGLYTFSTSFVPTQPFFFITITNEDGTEVLAAGAGSLEWSAPFSGTVRYYTHLTADCAPGAFTSHSRIVALDCENLIFDCPDEEAFFGDLCVQTDGSFGNIDASCNCGPLTYAGCTLGTLFGTMTANCNGSTQQVAGAWAQEFSNVNNILNGGVYNFSTVIGATSVISNVYITITNSTGTEILATGIDALTWTSDFNGSVRFYSHANDLCATGFGGSTTSHFRRVQANCDNLIFDCQELELDFGTPCDDGDPLTFFDEITEECVCAGEPLPPGNSCEDPFEVSSLPFSHSNHTENYVSTYTSADVPAEDFAVVGTGPFVPLYLNGFEAVYSYTASETEFINVTLTDHTIRVGLWAFTGCPFTSTVGYHTGAAANGRSINDLPVFEGETYYFVVSTWPSPTTTPFSISIESSANEPDCPELNLNIGTPCDDGNPNSIGAAINEDCECETEAGSTAGCAEYTSEANLPFGFSAPTITDVISVSGTDSVLTNLQVALDISHVSTQDVEVFLTGPNGTTITLVQSECGSGDNINVLLDNNADPLTCGPSGQNPILFGTFAPEGDLSEFFGGSFNGDWTLTVEDNFFFIDDGTLNSWCLIPTLAGDTPALPSIFEIVEASEIHNTLQTALEVSGLDATLDAAGTYTLFAPTDAAFDALEPGVLAGLLADPQGALSEVLLSHVAGEVLFAEDLSDGMMIETLFGTEVMVTINEDGVFIESSQVIVSDLEANNGVVHVIDLVLGEEPPLPSIFDIVADSDIHNTLETALVEASLDGTLSGEGSFTLFAPTDDAFDALPEGVLTGLLADPAGELTDILLYHVAGSVFMEAGLSDGQTITTLFDDQTVEISITPEGVFVNDAEIVLTDLMANNGVVHVINAVLIPEEPVIPQTIFEIVEGSEIHNTLEFALLESGLNSTLDAPGDYTLFAPTDAAFDALPTGLLDDLLADPSGALTDVLLYHVLLGGALAESLTDGQVINTLLGQSITVTVSADGIFINDAEVIVSNLEATNGIVHVIDAVLVPEIGPGLLGIFEIVAQSDVHETLETALEVSGLDATLSAPGSLTLFAPTDAAFDALPAGVLSALLADPTGDLTSVLLNHVVDGAQFSALLSDGQTLVSLFGEDLTISLGPDGIFINDAEITVVDLIATNGVVHVIDAVLVPDLTPSGACEDATAIVAQPTFAESEFFTSASGLTPTGDPQCQNAGNPQADQWFSFESVATVMYVRAWGLEDYDAAVEVYDACGGELLACQNTAPVGDREIVILQNTTPGETYFFRVYHGGEGTPSNLDYSVAVAHIPFIKLRDEDCGVFDYTPADVIRTELPVNQFLLTNFYFEFTELEAPFNTYEILSPNGANPNFQLQWFTQAQYGRTYSVRTRARMYQGPNWGDYGEACVIGYSATPLTTQLKEELALGFYNMCDILEADNVSGATFYRWRFFNDFDTLIETTTSRFIALDEVDGLSLGAPYAVRVRARSLEQNGPFGIMRLFAMNNFVPTTQVDENITVCGGTYPLNSVISAVEICASTSFTWRFTNLTDPTQPDLTYVRTDGLRTLSLSWVEGLIPGNTYAVQVFGESGGLVGEFGPACNITIAGGTTSGLVGQAQSAGFTLPEVEINVYPNPTRGDEVMVSMESLGDGQHQIVIEVFDIYGKKVHSQNVANEGSSMQVGLNFQSPLAAGIYTLNFISNTEVIGAQKLVVQK